MILGLRTDSPVAELYLYDSSGDRLAEKTWQADRNLAHELLMQLEYFLSSHEQSLQNVTGLVLYKGPGSFTSLRIGITVANTWAYSQAIPIVGETGNDWLENGIKRLQNGNDDAGVLPLYGSEPHITRPKK